MSDFLRLMPDRRCISNPFSPRARRFETCVPFVPGLVAFLLVKAPLETVISRWVRDELLTRRFESRSSSRSIPISRRDFMGTHDSNDGLGIFQSR